MSQRILVCLGDPGVAHVVAARLQQDGVDAVVVEKAARLVDESRDGVGALLVQDRYPTGEVGSSLLRQVRVSKGEPTPTVFLVTTDLTGPDKHVLERQYRVQTFLEASATPLIVAAALHAALEDDLEETSRAPESELVLHETEEKNQFDIEVASRPMEPPLEFDPFADEFDFLDEMAEPAQPPPAEAPPVEDPVAPGDASATSRGAEFPVDDFDGITVETSSLRGTTDGGPAEDASMRARLPDAPPLAPQSAALAPAPATLGASVARPAALPSSPPAKAVPPPSSEPDDPMQVQELKQALFAEQKRRLAAEQRAEEMAVRLSRLAPPRTDHTEIPPSGVFEELRYPSLLALCRDEGFTGAVKFEISGAHSRTVYIRDGVPNGFMSSEPGERIGKMMVAQKRITDEQYIRAATVMVERGIRLADALVELGFIEAETLAMETRNLTRDQIIQGFELTQGRFSIQAGATPDASVPTFDFGPGEIYLQGFRCYAPAQEMLALYETMRDVYLMANARLPAFRPMLGLGGEDERLLRLLGEAFTLEEAVEQAGLTEEHAARLIAALQNLGLVAEWSPGVEQFRARLKAERQRYAEEVARLREEMSAREQRLFEGFERALATLKTAADDGSPPATQPMQRSESEAPWSPAAEAAAPDEAETETPSPAASSAHALTLTEAAQTFVSQPALPHDESLAPVLSEAEEALGPMLLANLDAQFVEDVVDDVDDTAEVAVNPFGMLTGGHTPADQKYDEGVTAAMQDRLDEAEGLLREAVRMNAAHPEYLLALAKVLLANPRYERKGTLPVVRSLLDRAIQLAPEHAQVGAMHTEVASEMGG